jgi:HAD superfamily hydrolase (TIGR01509 family)
MGRKADGPFDLVIFDLDGVLVDSEPTSSRVTAAALTQAGIEISATDVCERFLGVSTASMLRTLEADRGCRLPESFQASLRARILAAFERELEPVPGVAALLDALPGDRCVASSSHPDRIRRSLELVGLLERFAPHLFSATMVRAGKPAPDLFLLAAAQMATAPASCLVIEDSEVGIRAAKAAGMTAFGFVGASHVRAETHARRLRAASADMVFAEMSALVELIGGGVD